MKLLPLGFINMHKVLYTYFDWHFFSQCMPCPRNHLYINYTGNITACYSSRTVKWPTVKSKWVGAILRDNGNGPGLDSYVTNTAGVLQRKVRAELAWPLSSSLGSHSLLSSNKMIPLIQSLQSIAILARHLEERHSPVVSCYTTPCSQLTPSDITCLASVASSCGRYFPHPALYPQQKMNTFNYYYLM